MIDIAGGDIELLENNYLLSTFFSESEKNDLLTLCDQSKAASLDLFSRLQDLANDAKIQAVYQRHLEERPEMVAEEGGWLAVLVRMSLSQIDEMPPWGALYLLYGYKSIITAKINFRLNPDPINVNPSPFLYAMK